MTGCFAAASGAGVTQVGCHAMRPAVADGFSSEEALGGQGWARWAVTRVYQSTGVGGFGGVG